MVVAVGIAGDAQRRLLNTLILDWPAKAVGLVEGIGVLRVVVEEAHGAVFVVVVKRTFGRIHREGFIVRTQSMAMRVGVRKDAGLEHFVRRPTDAGNNVRRAEGRLLDL